MRNRVLLTAGLVAVLLVGCNRRQDKDLLVVDGEYNIRLRDGKGMSVFSDDDVHIVMANISGETSILVRRNGQELLWVGLKHGGDNLKVFTTYKRDGVVFTVMDADGNGIPEQRGVKRPGEPSIKEVFVGGKFEAQ